MSLIWLITFQYRINLVYAIISWMEIVDVTNDQSKKLVSIVVVIN